MAMKDGMFRGNLPGVDTSVLFQAAAEDPFETGTRLVSLAQDSYNRIIGAYLGSEDAKKWAEVHHHVNEALRLALKLHRERESSGQWV